MTLTINWNTQSIDDWERRYDAIPYSNILQSYDYARAASPILKQKPRWGLIQIDGKDAGIVQIFETGILWNAFHTIVVDRGPLWFSGFGGALHIKLFFDEMNRQFPQRIGRKRRFLPEIEDGPTARKLIAQTGLQRRDDRKGHETVWLDLQQIETGRSNSNLTITVDTNGSLIDWAANIYATDKAMTGATGLSPKLFKSYAGLLVTKNNLIILQVANGDAPAGFAAVVVHGRSATYLAGWSQDTAAQTTLIQEATIQLQSRGIKQFDLGSEGAANGNQFKGNPGRRVVRYVGHYC